MWAQTFKKISVGLIWMIFKTVTLDIIFDLPVYNVSCSGSLIDKDT